MQAYLAHIRMNLRLTMRDRTVVFFNYLFPLMFFFMFAQLMGAEKGGSEQVVNMVLTIGVLGTGLFGAGMRAVMDREQNILRRFKVAPVSAGPILVASLITGIVHYLPLAALTIGMAHFLYGMATPQRLLSLLVFVAIGVLAFRGIGMMIASVVNSMQESQILIQMLYLPMLFLSGATIPISIMPTWVQVLAQFLPATHLFSGLQSILVAREGILDNTRAVIALALTALLGTFLGVKLFRWEKEEKVRGTAKLWLLAVLLPFLGMGAWESYHRENVVKSKILSRDLRRGRTLLIRNARIFTGTEVIESGSVLLKGGKIIEIYRGPAPEPKEVKADLIEASGKTLLPGLIDAHVHLAYPGGFFEQAADYQPTLGSLARNLAAYLYSGVTAVRSAGDPLDQMLQLRSKMQSAEWLGAELFLTGPMFTAEGGYPTHLFRGAPEGVRGTLLAQMVRLPKTAEDARRMTLELKLRGVNAIKTVMDAGQPGMLFDRMDSAVLRAIVEQARTSGLPVICHTGNAMDIADAVAAGVSGIEHGSARDIVPADLFARLKERGTTYNPMLASLEAVSAIGEGRTDLLDRSLVQQAGVPNLIRGTRDALSSPNWSGMRAGMKRVSEMNTRGPENLIAAWKSGVTLAAGSDSGNPLLVHGPGIHRELQLWVAAGVPPSVALRAATANAAAALGAGTRMGRIEKGYDASLVLVDGNPLLDITSTERISLVMLKGERLNRPELFDQR